MPPPDQQQVVKLPMPEGMNTVLPPYKLPVKRSPYILNMMAINGQLVGRGPMAGAATSTQTNRYPFSYISIPGRTNQLTMVYQYIKATATTWFIPYWLYFGNLGLDLPASVSLVNNTLPPAGSDFTFSYYLDKTRQSETVASATTDMSSNLPGPQYSNYNGSVYAPSLGLVSIEVLRWGGSGVTTTVSAAYTFTLGSTTAGYTTLSTANYANLPDQILVDPNSLLTYRVVSQSPLTSTTGNVTLDVAWRSPNLVQTIVSANIAACAAGTATLPTSVRTSKLVCTAVFRDRLFAGGEKGSLIWSKPGQPDFFAASNYLLLPSGNIIDALYYYNNKLLIFTSNEIYQLTGYDEGTFVLNKITDNLGSLHQTSMVIINNIFYFSNELGIWAYNGETISLISEEVENLYRLMYQGSSQTETGNFQTGTYVCATSLRNRYLVVTVHNVFELNTAYLYSFLYDTVTQAFTLFGRNTAVTGKSLPSFYCTFNSLNSHSLIEGVTAYNNLQEINDIIPHSTLGQRANARNSDTSNGTPPGATEIIYTVHSPGYVLNDDGTSRINEIELEHSSMYGATTPTTDTAAAVTIYKDNNAPAPFGTVVDQFVTAVNTTPYQVSYSKTNTANNVLHPRIDFFARILDPTIANFDCHSFIITMTTDPAIVGANNTFTFNSWGAFFVRYQATRQFRVQD